MNVHDEDDIQNKEKECETETSPEISFKPESEGESGSPVFEADEQFHASPVSEVPVGLSEDDLKEEFLRELASEEPGIGDGESLDVAPEVNAQSEDGDSFAIPEELTLMGKIEAILFASPKPLRSVEIHELIMDQGYSLKETQDALDELTEFYRDRAGGFHLKYIKRMGYQFQTTSAAKSLMEKQFSSRPRPLSRASLETLAVVAYRQKSNRSGVTRAEVEFIRGVDAGSIFKTLVERGLLTCTGRKEIPGRPMMFGVTDEFLKVFQLGSINDLPPLESFQTPSDVIQAANEKIAEFEAEQEGVNPEEFIGDEVYTENLGDSEFDILAAEAAPYSPTLARLEEVKQEVAASEVEEKALDAIPADILAEMAAESLYDASETEKQAATLEAQEIAVPSAVIDNLAGELIDRLEEGEIAFVATDIKEGEKFERELEGATLAVEGAENDWDDERALQEEPLAKAAPPPEVLPDETLEAEPTEKMSES